MKDKPDSCNTYPHREIAEAIFGVPLLLDEIDHAYAPAHRQDIRVADYHFMLDVVAHYSGRDLRHTDQASLPDADIAELQALRDIALLRRETAIAHRGWVRAE